MLVRLTLAAAMIGGGLCVSQARAQHVVTEAEASKLTLDALIATPRPIYRALYHPAMAMHRAHRPGYVSRQMHAARASVRPRRIRTHFTHR